MADTTNVTTGKPLVGGAIYRAKTSVTLPTSARTTLSKEFMSLGYISDDGVVNSNSPETEPLKAWGGDTVSTVQKGKPDTFTFTLIEALNKEVLKTVYGSDNVSTSEDTNEIKVKANAKEAEESSYVIDMIMNKSTLKRITIPKGKITDVGEITYKDEELVGYKVTLTLFPDETENTHYEYIVSKEDTTNDTESEV